MLTKHTTCGLKLYKFMAKPLVGYIILKGGLWSGHPVVTQSYEECMKLRTKRMKSFTGLKNSELQLFLLMLNKSSLSSTFFCVYNCKRF